MFQQERSSYKYINRLNKAVSQRIKSNTRAIKQVDASHQQEIKADISLVTACKETKRLMKQLRMVVASKRLKISFRIPQKERITKERTHPQGQAQEYTQEKDNHLRIKLILTLLMNVLKQNH